MQLERPARLDALEGLAVALVEARAQCFVALHQVLEACAHGVFIQLAAQTQRAGNGVSAAVGLQLPGNPQTVLRQGLRQFGLTRQGLNRAFGDAAVLLQTGDAGGKTLQGGRFEQQPQVQLQPQAFT